MAEAYDAVVVGGGLAGISAALGLMQQGRHVLLLEASSRLGGKMGTLDGGFPLGPTSFNGRHPEFWKLLTDLEIPASEVKKLHARSSARYIVRNGKLRALLPNPLSVALSQALTMKEKWTLVNEFLSPQPNREAKHDEPLRDLLLRRFGASLTEHLFEAVFTGIFAGDTSRLSAQSCMPALVRAEKEYGSILKGLWKSRASGNGEGRSGLFALASGFDVIVQMAEKRIPHRRNTKVDSLAFSVEGVVARAGDFNFHARQMVLATEAPVSARLLAEVAPEATNILETFEYVPVTLLHWAERYEGESALPHGFGYLASRYEGLFGLGTVFVGDLLGETPRRFSTFIGGGHFPERASLPESALVDGVAHDLQRLTGGKLGQVHHVVRWPQAVFQPPVGHAALCEKLTASLAPFPITLAGSYLGGASMKDALASGFSVALQGGQSTAIRSAS